ncbi:MAG: hypothetical protein M0C28_15125 [Candidatus Moduliflexus flocculans]|nr:hypothetical protein [Candidatus Moduliflexus flocculans]
MTARGGSSIIPGAPSCRPKDRRRKKTAPRRPMDIGAHPSSRATASDAARLARELYGLEARVSPLPSEYDDNFLVGDTRTGSSASSRSCTPCGTPGSSTCSAPP